ncbi:DEAD/DEAH box helicase family protein [Rhizorhabdus sp.]|uniref:DEAD/DEAH box helicase family protein n=1 Tax=Rhizorhabdus sp. TaxID=1968843 RepID=UPI0019B1D074|nr:DEAD/DEAH box helicase family protein [Rhizorhabdus sp.]MBD3761920.1 DEAD/DEAH box helicase family protein [Rhizorhabdus sp.]
MDAALVLPPGLPAFDFDTEYRSLKDDPVGRFYVRCLSASKLYRRAVGYFRSTVYLVIGPSILDFARRGGRIELICSPELSEEDIDGIAAGYRDRDEVVAERLRADIDELLSNSGTAYQTRVLATLIAVGALDIKVAVRSGGKGIYHEKIGIFIDHEGNRVSFRGSANETWNGWHSNGNFESIEVFCDWREGRERERVAKHEKHFLSLWSETDADIEVFSFPKHAIDHLKKASIEDLNIMDRMPESETAPHRRQPLPHQSDALAAWVGNNCRGILEHATGSGKTFTAIVALREHVSGGMPAIVLVPSLLLLEQWAIELREEIPDAALLLAGGGNSGWKSVKRLQSMTANDTNLGGRIVLAMMQTAATDAFRSSVVESDNLMIVADEVHQIGSRFNSQFLSLNAGKRLGLSATPTRYGDPDGTSALMAYFDGVVPPPFTLIDAISSGRLVQYEYFPHPLNLTATEADDWKKISLEIRTEMARQKEDSNGQRQLSERAKMLLIRRSRIAKKASKKVDLAREIVQKHYTVGEHWLIYCEDSDQLQSVIDALKQDGHAPIEYHSGMGGDRHATLDWFRAFGGLLVSIRCLDEGVDIPAISHAIILASSQNPRQFIQRRGRVLRTTPGKHFAVIHDAIVVPVSLESEPEQTSLLKAEMLRSIEFANHAVNKMAAAELRTIANNLGFDPDVLTDVGVEEGGNDDE